ncbi:unnamed protein product [Amoebophrya sp. A120]|nr:unnamed protein product [Amoebophrya sp. A120]|eukprot:GSA120T00001221001.1
MSVWPSSVTLMSPMNKITDLPTASKLLSDFLHRKSRVLVLTGAGISKDSGIPDYRGKHGSYKKGHRPMTIQEFKSSTYMRKRYWTRGFFGYKNLNEAKPNAGHRELARLANRWGSGTLGVDVDASAAGGSGELQSSWLRVITQNVDGLHQRAGSPEVLELHGSLHRIVCGSCGHEAPYSREEMQQVLFDLNQAKKEREVVVLPSAASSCPSSASSSSDESNSDYLFPSTLQLKDVQAENFFPVNADGDAEVEDEDIITRFRLPACQACGKDFLRPDVVYFGDKVPGSRWDTVSNWTKHADGLITMGTSLAVGSAWRVMRQCVENGVREIVVVNEGPVRVDEERDLGQLKQVVKEDESGTETKRPPAVEKLWVHRLEVGCSEVLVEMNRTT